MDGGRIKWVIGVVALLSVCVLSVDTGAEQSVAEQECGVVAIDFGCHYVRWTTVDFDECPTAIDSLDCICKRNGYSYSVDENGNVTSIDGVRSNFDSFSWGLWVVEHGKTEWVKVSAPYSVSLADYAVSSWAYRDLNEEPMAAVDQSGRPIYGYDQVKRVVSLAPSITEIICDIKATDLLVGVDKHSDYPNEIMEMRNEGSLAVVGGYGTALFEEILRTKPDMVLCDGSQYDHIQIANKLRSLGIESVVLCPKETFDGVLDNIYTVGVVLGRSDDAIIKIRQIERKSMDIITLIENGRDFNSGKVMVVLGLNASPFVAGSHTYVGDIIVKLLGKNAFADLDGWLPVNRELVAKNNPARIVVLTTAYKATQSEYDSMLLALPDDWKSTDAYKNGEIYMMCEGAGDMMQRPSPRVTQMMGLMAKILHPDTFHLSKMPKFVGNDYESALDVMLV